MSRPAQLAAAFAAGMLFANLLPRLGVVEIVIVAALVAGAFVLGRRSPRAARV